MKKFYSFVLMAMMLLVGTTAWAATYSVGEGGDYSTFSAFWSAQGASLSNADEVTLVSNTGLDVDPGTYDFNGATVICQNFRLKIYKNTGEYTFQNAVVNCNQYAFLVNTASGIVLNLENVQVTSAGISNTDDHKTAAIYISSTGINATINIDANSSIVSTNTNYGKAIWAVAGATTININNSGEISGGKYGFYVLASANITNTNTGVITTCSNAGIYTTAALTLENAGTIQNCATGVNTTAAANITNTSTGVITTCSNAGINTTKALTLQNDGLIEKCDKYGVYVRYTGEAVTDITNNGTISSKWYGVYSYVDNYNATITNHGLIKATSISNSGMGVYARKSNVDNYGTITCTSSKATYHGLQSAAAHITNEVGGVISAIYVPSGRYETGNVITNNGTITKGVNTKFYSNTAGTTTYPAEAYITNEGEITQTLGGEGKLFITNNGTLTISDGTFTEAISFEGSNNTNITGGSFSAAPLGSMGYINPGDGAIKFAEGVGALTIADGYTWRNVDKMVAPNGGVVEVTHANSSSETRIIEEAFAYAADGDVITLIEDVKAYSSLWLGTAEMAGAYKSVTLDLNGHTLSSDKNVKRTITLSHGALYIINSVPGQGGIVHLRSNAQDQSSDIIYVTGSTLKTVNPRTAAIADLFTYLLVDEGVNIIAEGDLVNGVSVFELGHDYGVGANLVSGVTYETNIYSNYLNWSGEENKQMGVANGVRIDIKGNIDVQKYGVKPNGNLRSSLEFLPDHAGDGIAANDTSYSAFIHIFPTAVVRTSNAESAAAVYASGYARWLIEGTCQGATGVYAKSGVIDFTDAIIESTYTGEETIITGKGSGIAAGGNAVVIESNGHYTGDHSLVINGDTKISTEAQGGAAIVDVVDSNHESKVDNITINGGTFTADNAIVISSETATDESAEVTVNGVTVIGQITVGGSTAPEDVANIMGANTHTTEIENPDGSKTVVVSAGAAPAAATEWTAVAALEEGSDAKWTGFTAGVIANGETVELGELQIISGDEDHLQQLTIEDGAMLKVARLIMNDYARITVEAGGQLIVTGEQGINAPNVTNILLKTQENKPAIFLFNPAVTSNRNPKATVEFASKSCYRYPDKANIYQRFGIPMMKNGLESIEAAGDHETRFYVYNYTEDKWKGIGYINPSAGYEDQPLDYSKLNDPFEYYQLLDFDVNVPSNVVYTMKGNLLGNSEPVMKIFENSWKGFANSYMGKMKLSELLALIPNTVDKAIYTYNVNQAFASWEPVSNLNVEGKMLNPMQPFLIRNRYDAAEVELDYAATVYNPTMGIVPNGAPSRAANNFTMATITIANEMNADYVIVAEDAQFSAEFDNGYDASKFMNDEVNLYVEAEENMSIFATDNLENTTLGVSSVLGGKYTITFSNVKGNNFVLVDNLTGAQAAMVEGNSYEFVMEANAVNSHRFEIVSAAKMPTALENAEVKANVKGVYTLMGQYLGEKIDKLPAGVYVVDGVKVVK